MYLLYATDETITSTKFILTKMSGRAVIKRVSPRIIKLPKRKIKLRLFLS